MMTLFAIELRQLLCSGFPTTQYSPTRFVSNLVFSSSIGFLSPRLPTTWALFVCQAIRHAHLHLHQSYLEAYNFLSWPHTSTLLYQISISREPSLALLLSSSVLLSLVQYLPESFAKH